MGVDKMIVIKYDKLKKIGNDIDKIFKEVTENDNLTLDELNRLSIENDKLNFSLADYNTKLNYEIIDLTNNLKDKSKAYRLLMILTMFILGIFICGMSTVTALALIILGCLTFRANHNMKKTNEYLDVLIKDIDNVKKITNRLSITLDNNELQIFKKQKAIYFENIKEIKNNKEDIDKLEKANALIQMYILFDTLPTDVDEEIKNIAKRVLQLDLNKNEDSLEYLLNCAKEKVESEVLNLNRKL